LYATDEGQRFDIAVPVLAKASLRPGRSGQQRIALIKANRVNTESNFFGNDSDLHAVVAPF
jgi:hypothetical protein